MSISAFAFLHIIYSNWTAVLLSLAGGFFFTKTCTKTGSLLTTTVEHTLYGWLIFTIGQGVCFHN
jgi:membrane protease YdiL (CAAX protease family)